MLCKILHSYIKYKILYIYIYIKGETCKSYISHSHCSAFQILLKMLSKNDPCLMTDNISVNFEICMLSMQMKGSSAIQKKKNFTSQLGLMLVAVH